MPYYPHKKENKIDYDQAPSGHINIEKWEPPFMPVSTGFGFIGVLAEDSVNGELQCHECGNWYEQLPTHLVKHGMTADSYRQKFGLFTQTALKSKRIRLIQSEVMSNFRKTGQKKFLRKFGKGNLESANRKGKPKAVEGQNSFGVCDLQISTKILALADKLGRTPTLIELKKEYGQKLISVMYMRYGSYVQYCRKHLKIEPGFSNFNVRSEQSWREHLIGLGKDGINRGGKITLKGLNLQNKSPSIYKHFGSFGKYKDELLKRLMSESII